GSADRYRWVALSNTTLGVFLALVNQSIVIISLPAIFRGIGLNPLTAGNVSYLLWLLIGSMLVTAVLVVTLGKLGDMYGRVRLYNAGFAVFTAASIMLSIDPLSGGGGALWLIVFRIVQGAGGAMLFANSTAIVTDAFPVSRRGFALGINQVAALAGSFVGLIAGGLLAQWNWRAVFVVSVPIGIVGTLWSIRSLREVGRRHLGHIDWLGNVTFALGLTAFLVAITYGIQPYGGHDQGWTNPLVVGGLLGGAAMLVVFAFIELHQPHPMFRLDLFRVRAFAAGNVANLLAGTVRGGMQFMLILWLQGIWLPLHGYDYEKTPLWAGIYLLPLTAGVLVAGPLSGSLSDRHGARAFSTSGMVLVAVALLGLLLIPVNFTYWLFAVLIAAIGVGFGLFGAPNTTAIMNSVPARDRGAAAGMTATFSSSGGVLSIGVFFSLIIVGLSQQLPSTMNTALLQQQVPAAAAQHVSSLPPVGSLFSAFLGYNPMAQLLGDRALTSLPPSNAAVLTGKSFFPGVLSGPFHTGLVLVFGLAIAMSLFAAAVSFSRGSRYVHVEREHEAELGEAEISLVEATTAPLIVVPVPSPLRSDE
ncbi:MAG TPA: MFS transporter, partial [Candidatus Dormibacteraeota bacterium]|nr:MFS transporter [Candidatus Dormibacteraeota bacterium]